MDLTASDEGLPLIENGNASSNLASNKITDNEANQMENSNFIILQTTEDIKLPLNLPADNYIVLKETISTDMDGNIVEKNENECINWNNNNLGANSLNSLKQYDRELLESILYFVCNLCPFLCTKETKIVEHLQNAHKNKTSSKLVQLKCPACANIFFHKESLQSHLLHDHSVAIEDISLIVQAIVFYASKNNKVNENGNANNNSFQKINESNEINSCFATFTNNNENIDSIKINQNESIHFYTGNDKEMADKEDDASHFDLQNIATVDDDKHGAASAIADMPIGKMSAPPQIMDIVTSSEDESSSTSQVVMPVILIKNQKCLNCKIVLKDSNKMDYHMKSHSNDGRFKCLECQEVFLLWKSLASHLWRLHKIDMELYSCDKCDYKTNNLSILNRAHKFIHSNVKAYQCEVCEKAFKNQKQVRNHRKIHRIDLEKKTFKCETCAKVFADRRRLRNHMEIVHMQLKPFLCSYCGYKGSNRGSLKMHIRSHTGEKPFKCDQCIYSTADHNSLRRHKLRHTGDKPYKCSYCPYACIQSSTYKVHLKTKHPGLEKDLMFTCFKCQFRTVNKQMFNMHMINIHNEKIKLESAGVNN